MVASTVRPTTAALLTLTIALLAPLLFWLTGKHLPAVLGAAAAVLIATAVALAATHKSRKTFGGITGDTLGATIELALPTTLLTLALTT